MLTPSQRRTAPLLAGGLLLLSLFLKWMGQNAAVTLLFDPPPAYANPGLLCRLALLLIAVSAGVILFYGLKRQGAYPVPQKLLFTLPAVMTAIAFVAIRAKLGRFAYRPISLTDVFGAGFWLCLLASMVLLFLGWTAHKSGSGTPEKSGTIE